MERVESTIKKIIDNSPNTKSFILTMDKEIDFLPGQAITLIINKKRAAFSIASTPKNKKEIMITVKGHKNGRFSPYLFAKKEGDKVAWIGPYGKFTFNEGESREYYFIAGGIGITPFRSMILYAAEKNLPIKMSLLYSARNLTSLIFYDEFKQLEKKGKLAGYYTVTKDSSAWQDKTGRLTKEDLKSIIKNKNALFYICGPPSFIEFVQTSLLDLSIEKTRIRIDNWGDASMKARPLHKDRGY